MTTKSLCYISYNVPLWKLQHNLFFIKTRFWFDWKSHWNM